MCRQEMITRAIKKIILGKISEFIISYKLKEVVSVQVKANKAQMPSENLNYYDRIIAPNTQLEKSTSQSLQKETGRESYISALEDDLKKELIELLNQIFGTSSLTKEYWILLN